MLDTEDITVTTYEPDDAFEVFRFEGRRTNLPAAFRLADPSNGICGNEFKRRYREFRNDHMDTLWSNLHIDWDFGDELPAHRPQSGFTGRYTHFRDKLTDFSSKDVFSFGKRG